MQAPTGCAARSTPRTTSSRGSTSCSSTQRRPPRHRARKYSQLGFTARARARCIGARGRLSAAMLSGARSVWRASAYARLRKRPLMRPPPLKPRSLEASRHARSPLGRRTRTRRAPSSAASKASGRRCPRVICTSSASSHAMGRGGRKRVSARLSSSLCAGRRRCAPRCATMATARTVARGRLPSRARTRWLSRTSACLYRVAPSQRRPTHRYHLPRAAP